MGQEVNGRRRLGVLHEIRRRVAFAVSPELKADLDEAHRINESSWTGVLNRLGFERRLDELESRRRSEPEIQAYVITIDLDELKYVNDFHGHPAGDVVLQAVADRLTSIPHTTVGHISGDEFAIILEEHRVEGNRVGAPMFPNKVIHERRSDRRGLSVEDLVPSIIREEIDRVMGAKVKVPSHAETKDSNGEAEIDIHVSMGIARVDGETDAYKAYRDSDDEMYRDKSGLQDFLDCQQRMGEVTQTFVAESFGFKKNPEVRGGYEIDHSMSIAACSLDPRFEGLIRQLADTPKALKYVFPELSRGNGRGLDRRDNGRGLDRFHT